MQDRIITILKFAVGWPLSAIALYFIIKSITPNFKDVLANVHAINVTLLFWGIVNFFLFYLLRSIKWHMILKEKEHNISLKDSTFLWASAELKRYIPGNVWSVLGRTVLFNKMGIAKKDIVTAMIIELEFVVLGTVLIALLSTPFLTHVVFKGYPYDNLLSNLAWAGTIIASAIFVLQKRIVKRLPAKYTVWFKHFLPLFSEKKTLIILALTSLACLCFGLGYYFVITSIVFLHPQDVFGLSGFFVLSLLLGFLSFLTPAGLGVREGIITLGLAKIIPLSLAGFASLFGRIILIVSELLFIIFAYVWYRLKDERLSRIDSFLNSYPYEILLTIGMGIYAIYFTIASYLRFDNFYTGRFDLGNMAQTVWNSSQGRIFEFTNPNGTEIISRLAFHADFFLVLLAPFYLLWSSPKVLLLIQAITVASGAIFVYLIGKDVLKNRGLALVFAMLYLLNPSLERATLYDFHSVTIGTTLLLGAFYFMQKKKYAWFLVFVLLAALTKEQIWIIIALFAAYIGIFQKRYLFGVILFLFSSFMFYYLVAYLIPHVAGSNHFALSYYSDFGDKPGNVIENMLLHPAKIFRTITTENRLHYLHELFMPLGYLSFLAPYILIFAIPEFLINLLSNNAQAYQIYYQYTSAITPFLFISALYGLSNLRRLVPKLPNGVIVLYLAVVALYTANAFGPLPGAHDANLEMFSKQVANSQTIRTFLRTLPRKSSIAATNNLGSHLSNRQLIYTIPLGIDKADYVAFLLNDPNAQPSLPAQKEMAMNMKHDPTYKLLIEDGDFVVFKKIKQ